MHESDGCTWRGVTCCICLGRPWGPRACITGMPLAAPCRMRHRYSEPVLCTAYSRFIEVGRMNSALALHVTVFSTLPSVHALSAGLGYRYPRTCAGASMLHRGIYTVGR